MAAIVTERCGHTRTCTLCGAQTYAPIPADIRKHRWPRLMAAVTYLASARHDSKRDVPRSRRDVVWRADIVGHRGGGRARDERRPFARRQQAVCRNLLHVPCGRLPWSRGWRRPTTPPSARCGRWACGDAVVQVSSRRRVSVRAPAAGPTGVRLPGRGHHRTAKLSPTRGSCSQAERRREVKRSGRPSIGGYGDRCPASPSDLGQQCYRPAALA